MSANTAKLQAELGLKISDFEHALKESEKQGAASGARQTAAQKKLEATMTQAKKNAAADRAKQLKEEERAAIESAQRQAEAHRKASDTTKDAVKDSLSSVRGGFGANNAGEMMASGFEAIGALGGPVAAVATGAGFIAKAMFDAKEEARELRKEMGALLVESHGMTSSSASSSDLFGQGLKMQEALNAQRRAKAEALEKLGPFGRPTENTVSNTVMGSFGEHANDLWAKHKFAAIGTAAIPIPGVGTAIGNWFDKRTGQGKNKTTKERQDEQNEALSKESFRMMEESATADREDLDVLKMKVQMSEREGDLQESELQTKREIARIEKEMSKARFAPEAIDKATQGVRDRAKLEEKSINKKFDEDQRNAADAVADAQEQASIAAHALRDDIHAGEQEITRLLNLAERLDQYGKVEPVREKKQGYEKEAALTRVAAQAKEVELAEKKRLLEQRSVQLEIEKKQAALGILQLTGREVANRAQIGLLQERIAANAKAMEYATPTQRQELDAANAGLQAEIDKLRILDALKSPTTKAQEKAADRAGRRAEAKVKARAKDKALIESKGGSHHANGDNLLAKAKAMAGAAMAGVNMGQQLAAAMQKPEVKTQDLAGALDQTQLATDIRTLAQFISSKPRF